MLRTVLLLPVEDNEGRSFAAEDWQLLETRLRAALGGFTLTGETAGAWAGEGGRVYGGASRQYVVSLDSCRLLPAWLAVVEWALVHFRQQAIYVEIAGAPEILHRRATD